MKKILLYVLILLVFSIGLANAEFDSSFYDDDLYNNYPYGKHTFTYGWTAAGESDWYEWDMKLGADQEGAAYYDWDEYRIMGSCNGISCRDDQYASEGMRIRVFLPEAMGVKFRYKVDDGFAIWDDCTWWNTDDCWWQCFDGSGLDIQAGSPILKRIGVQGWTTKTVNMDAGWHELAIAYCERGGDDYFDLRIVDSSGDYVPYYHYFTAVNRGSNPSKIHLEEGTRSGDCNDFIDNDGDWNLGAGDYENDGIAAFSFDQTTYQGIYDISENDFPDFGETNVDCFDAGCEGKSGPPDFQGSTGLCNFETEKDCGDNYDNDFDGLVDYNDGDCVCPSGDLPFAPIDPSSDTGLDGCCGDDIECTDMTPPVVACANNPNCLALDVECYISSTCISGQCVFEHIPGCVPEDCEITIGRDFGFITEERDWFCYYDTSTEDWDWEWSQGDNDYFIYPLIDRLNQVTSAISNTEDWFYCQASGQDHNMNPTATLADNQVLPAPEEIMILDNGLYQYFPDTDCDGHADCDSEPYDNIENNGEDWSSCTTEPHHACELDEYGNQFGSELCMDSANWSITCPSMHGEGCPSYGEYAGDLSYDGYQWVPPEDGEDCIPEGDVDGGCTNDIDDDADGFIDCMDADCVDQCDYPGGIPIIVSSNYSAGFLCYERSEDDYMAECCPYFSNCFNTNQNVVQNFNYVSTGSQTHVLSNFDFVTNPPSAHLRRRTQGTYSDINVQNVDLAGYGYISFNMISTVDMKMTLIFNDTTSLPPIELNQYSTNGIKPNSFHHYKILINSNKVLDNINFAAADDGNFRADIDTIILEAAASAINSDNRICSGIGQWITSMDPPAYNPTDLESFVGHMEACNFQNPQGLGGIGWTGTQCCGDDTQDYYEEYYENQNSNNAEYYGDSLAGCWAGNKIPSDYRVGDFMQDESLDNLLFYEGKFYACNATDYSDFKVNFGAGKINTKNVVEYSNQFDLKGSWFCSPAPNGSIWTRINETTVVRVLAAKLYAVAEDNNWQNFTLYCDVYDSTLNDY
ncbi:MAG: hypothetical protein ABIE94_04455, partial [archaeon]